MIILLQVSSEMWDFDPSGRGVAYDLLISSIIYKETLIVIKPLMVF